MTACFNAGASSAGRPRRLYWDEAEEEWLTAYVLDFMTRAREQGFEVPDLAYTRGIRWLSRFVSQDRNSGHDLAVEAYAYYVLARAHGRGAPAPLLRGERPCPLSADSGNQRVTGVGRQITEN